MHRAKLLYINAKDARQLVDVNLDDGIKPIGIQRYTDFEANKHLEANGTYPCLTSDTFDELYGKVLTQVDASFTDATQREAFKSVMRNTLSDWYTKQLDYTFNMAAQLHPKK